MVSKNLGGNVDFLTKTEIHQYCSKKLFAFHDDLHGMYRQLKADMKKLGFVLPPRWTQHVLTTETAITRYIAQTLWDKHYQFNGHAELWLDLHIDMDLQQNPIGCGILVKLSVNGENRTRVLVSKELLQKSSRHSLSEDLYTVLNSVRGPQDQWLTHFREEVCSCLAP